jgi:lysyl endopeptidase
MANIFKISLIFCFVTIRFANAQLETAIGSISDYRIESWYELRIDSQVLKRLAESYQPKDESFQFAVPMPVSLNPENSGCIYNNKDESVWVLGIRSKEAKSLNLILEPYNLPEGAYIYIYDSSKKTVRGAFTDKNNSVSGVLPTMPVPGSELILEYHIPAGTKWSNTLGISQISHDFIGLLESDGVKDGRYKLSQACNSDINCTAGDQYSVEKRSVCRLIVRGIELCTGVLLNNTNQQNRPFLLTAQHCIVDQNDADKSIFVFGYESPWCSGPDGSVSHSLSGSELMSTNTEIDFSLVELKTFPPMVYKPYLAGWDVSGSIPSYTATIHHPMGDVKKISIDNDPPVTGTFTNMPSNSFWKIVQWDAGTTEGGSSGAPLFDQNKRVAGILTGGEAVCGRSVNDYFAKLSVIYNLSSVIYQQLKGWIDPAVSGVKQLNGRDPYTSNWLTSDTLSNIEATEKVISTIYSLPWQGYLTGYNTDSIIMYAEYFKNITGHEISEVWLNISKANSVATTDSVRVFVMGDGPSPGTVLGSQKIYIREAKDSFRLRLDFNNTVPVTGNFYIAWRIYYTNKAISETRQFALYHSPDRLLPEKNSAWFNDGSTWKPFVQHPFAPMSVSLDVRVITVASSVVNHIPNTKSSDRVFLIYPNPASDQVIISSKNALANIGYRIMDIAGNVLQVSKIAYSFPGEAVLNVSNIKKGFYLLSLFSEGFSETHKVLINR